MTSEELKLGSLVEHSSASRLSEEEGKKIASYIRSLSTESTDLERHGRPWNPPYQPGPELKDKSIEEWAAGAGLDAVLDKDTDMLEYMFPGVSLARHRIDSSLPVQL